MHQKGKWSPIALGENYMPIPMSAQPSSGNSANATLTLSGPIKVPTTRRSPFSCQFLQQKLGFFQVRGVESLGEPGVDLRE